MDLSNRCRLCFLELHNPRDIFTTSGLLERIKKFIDIEISSGDGLPSQICDLCDAKLLITEEFRTRIEKTDKLIRALVPIDRLDTSSHDESALIAKDSLVPQHLPNGRINCEKIQNWRKFSEWQSARKREESSDSRAARSLVYSDSTAASLVASYKALMSDSQSCGSSEEFMLPSFFANILENKVAEEKDSPHSKTVPLVDNQFPSPQDPLNLLKVKSVQPLRNADSVDRNSNLRASSSAQLSHGRKRPAICFAAQESNEDSETSISTKSSLTINCFKYRGQTPIENSKHDEEFSFSSTPQETTVNCPVCGKNSRNIRGAMIHIGRVHRSDNCLLCQAQTRTKDQFKYHMRCHLMKRIHETLRNYHCDICNKSCETRASLEIHKRIHSRSVPADVRKCFRCGKTYVTRNGYRKHLIDCLNYAESE